MSEVIDLALTSRPLERTHGEIAVVGFFTDERPLRGGAARADWRLCGGLSKRIESGDLSGKSGEALLMGCGLALVSPRLLLLGLGDRQAFDQLRLSDETASAMDRCLKLGLSRVVLAPLGISSDDIPRHAASLLAGLRDAWRSATRPMTLQFCVPAGELASVRRAFEDARKAARAEEVNLISEDVDLDSRS